MSARPLPWTPLAPLLAGGLILMACAEPRTYTSVAVLPFLDTSPQQADSRHLAEGIAQHLAAKLGGLDGIRIAPFDEARRFADPGIPARSVGEALSVEAILSGSLRAEGGKVHVSLALTEADGRRVRTATFEQSPDRLFDLQSMIAREAAGWIKQDLSDRDLLTFGRPPARTVPAWDFYLRGAQAMQADDEMSLNLAVSLFRKAVDLDPDLAQAWLGLGAVGNRIYFDGWGEEEDLLRAESSFRSALGLDPDLAEARLGLIHNYAYRGLCRETLRVGLEGKDRGRTVDGVLVLAEAYLYAGLADDALPLLETVLSYEPDNDYARYQRIVSLIRSGRHDQVMEQGRRFLEDGVQGGSIAAEVHYYLSQSAMTLGRISDATEHATRMLAIMATVYRDERQRLLVETIYGNMAVIILRAAGRASDARSLLTEALQGGTRMVDETQNNALLTLWLALLHAVDGDTRALLRDEITLLRIAPDNTMVLTNLGAAWLLANDMAKAHVLLDTVHAMGCPSLHILHQWEFLIDDWDDPEWQRLLRESERAADRLRALAGLPARGAAP